LRVWPRRAAAGAGFSRGVGTDDFRVRPPGFLFADGALIGSLYAASSLALCRCMIIGIVDRTERFYKIDRLLREQRIVTFTQLQTALEVSRATLKRDLEYMRSRLHAPIEFDRALGGYRLARADATGKRYELPGVWFSPSEIHALLTLQHLVANLRAGSVLAPHVTAIANRLTAALGDADQSLSELRRRVRIIDIASRHIELAHFETVGSALIKRRRIKVTYFGRARGDLTARIVSPQRLIHYRDNWYLDAYCHLREDVRSFSVDAIRAAVMLETEAVDIDDQKLDRVLGSGYGIFSGEQVTWATLRFTPACARWVGAERWHPEQRVRVEADGSLMLEIPYSDPRELTMDILRHGADVEVIAPQALRDHVITGIDLMRQRYALHP
jgi:predicted DNA-binding transcriptional regulator YafY